MSDKQETELHAAIRSLDIFLEILDERRNRNIRKKEIRQLDIMTARIFRTISYLREQDRVLPEFIYGEAINLFDEALGMIENNDTEYADRRYERISSRIDVLRYWKDSRQRKV